MILLALLCVIVVIIFIRTMTKANNNSYLEETNVEENPEEESVFIKFTPHIEYNYTVKTVDTKEMEKFLPPRKNLYSVIYNDSEFPDNMNYKLYKARAVYTQTQRKRSVEVKAFNLEEAKEYMLSNGFKEPIEITQISFPPPTDRQVEACIEHNTQIPDDVCQYDLSAIISKEVDYDTNPNPELVHFATAKGLKFSYYIGKKALYNYIWDSLQGEDKIAFFAFAIYRFVSDDRQANLDKSQHRDVFYQFAKTKLEDVSFIRSMEKYKGENLRYFGKISVDGIQMTGGSKNTIAYKDTIAYLKEKISCNYS